MSAGGLEPPTLCLKGRCSTAELRARFEEAKYIIIFTNFQHYNVEFDYYIENIVINLTYLHVIFTEIVKKN